jgi:hypothetical protein
MEIQEKKVSSHVRTQKGTARELLDEARQVDWIATSSGSKPLSGAPGMNTT